jgi:8-oxo-dGTP diphosphatase
MTTDVINQPRIAVDTVALAIEEGRLKVLLLQITSGPYDKKWAVPGGLLRPEESTDEAAKRVLLNKTNVSTAHLEQLYTFSKPGRDVRGQVVSVAYYFLVNDLKKLDIKTQGHYAQISWIDVDKLPAMAFDHKMIVETAVKRLQDKIGYSTIAYALLPPIFTLSEMQQAYEIVLGKKLDKRNFRKRILQLDFLEKAGKIKEGAFRPAEMYRFSKKEMQYFN